MKRLLCIIVVLISASPALAARFGGVVKDLDTKEPIPYAVINLTDLGTMVQCDSAGSFYFNVDLPKNFYIVASATGYESQRVQLGEHNLSTLEILLRRSHTEIGTLVVSSPTGTLENLTIANIESVNLSDLRLTGSGTLGEMITNIPSVYQSTTGTGISKPVIRGLSGNRVITYLNGLRIENQQWGGDHALGVSDLGIGRVEVIKGPASLLYGSDALGGVLYLVDEEYAPHNSVEIAGTTRGELATMGTKNSVGFKISKGKIRANVFGNYIDHADYQLPNGNYGLNSRYNEQNVKLALGFNHKGWVSNVRYNYLRNRLGIPGHTHDTIILPETFQTSEQNRNATIPAQVNQNHYVLWENHFYFEKDKLEVVLGQTSNQLQEFEERFTIPALEMNLNSSTYNVRYKKNIEADWNWVLGAQGMYQTNKNAPSAEEQLIPDARLFDNGLYGLITSHLPKWNFEAGARFDTRSLKAYDEMGGVTSFTGNYNSINFSFGATRMSDRFVFKGNITSGFRAPHTSELLSDGEHHGALRYEIGNSNLTSEKAIQLDLSMDYNTRDLSIMVNPYVNLIRDYIAVNPVDSMIDGLPVFEYSQLGQAILYGADIGFKYQPEYADFISFESNMSTVFGVDGNGEALSLIPQNRINSSLQFEFGSKGKIQLRSFMIQHQYLFAQNQVSLLETTSEAYQLINMALNLRGNFKHRVDLNFGVRNLLNETYIDHLSRLKNIGLPNVGLNFFIGLNINLNYRLKAKQ